MTVPVLNLELARRIELAEAQAAGVSTTRNS
jgi:hypothetical protein